MLLNLESKIKSKLKLKGSFRAILRNAKTGRVTMITPWKKNLIPIVGLQAILHRLGNDAIKSNEGMITYGAVGSGSAIPQSSDTIMENEIGRKAVSVTTVSGLDLNIEVFFTTAEGNGTISQWALFGEDATAAADTGTMFEHVSFDTPFTKAATETLTVEITLSIS